MDCRWAGGFSLALVPVLLFSLTEAPDSTSYFRWAGGFSLALVPILLFSLAEASASTSYYSLNWQKHQTQLVISL